jgi:hypothetical protein
VIAVPRGFLDEEARGAPDEPDDPTDLFHAVQVFGPFESRTEACALGTPDGDKPNVLDGRAWRVDECWTFEPELPTAEIVPGAQVDQVRTKDVRDDLVIVRLDEDEVRTYRVCGAYSEQHAANAALALVRKLLVATVSPFDEDDEGDLDATLGDPTTAKR